MNNQTEVAVDNLQEIEVDFSKAEYPDDTKWIQRGTTIENVYGGNKVGISVPPGMVLSPDGKGGMVFRTYEDDEKIRSRMK